MPFLLFSAYQIFLKCWFLNSFLNNILCCLKLISHKWCKSLNSLVSDNALKTSKPRSPVHYAHCLSRHLLVNSTHGIRFFLASIFKRLTPLSKYIIAIIIIQHGFWDWSTGIFAFNPCLWYLRNCNNQYSTIDAYWAGNGELSMNSIKNTLHSVLLTVLVHQHSFTNGTNTVALWHQTIKTFWF